MENRHEFIKDIKVLASNYISREYAIDDLHGRDPSQIWDTADIEVWINALPSAESDVPDTNVGELISKQDAINGIGSLFHPVGGSNLDDYEKKFYENGVDESLQMIEELPSVHPDKDLIHLQKEQAYMQGYEDGRKSRKGKWIKIMKTNESETATFYTPTWICGDCKTEYDGAIANSIIKFCYNCGADMRGECDE